MLGELGIGIVGGLCAYLGSHFIAKLGNDNSEITEHIAEIMHVEEAAVSYWTFDAASLQARLRDEELAAKLQGQLLCTAAFRPRAQKLLGDSLGSYLDLDGKLFDLATGGEFSQVGRRPDFPRVIEINSICHALRNLLRTSRSRRFWAH